MLTTDAAIAENLRQLEEQIGAAALRSGRLPQEITLVGISKTHSAEAVVAATRAGLLHVGENRVQEAAGKFPRIKDLLAGTPMPTLHMVGHVQTNKASSAAGIFDRIDSVDSVRLAGALSRHVHPNRQLGVLLEVYVGDDPARPGLRPHELVEAAGQILALPGIRVDGLMTIAPLGGDAPAAFRQVQKLKQILSESFPAVHFGVLSMGMSDDYLLAIEEGSTEVRIGTALFGPRTPRY